MHRSFSFGALLLVASACAAVPPAPPVVRSGTAVSASFGKAWDAVIDEFSGRNLPIKTIDRSSGIIVTEALRANVPGAADCGSDMGSRLIPTQASYNVLVRGDSASAVVKVTPRFLSQGLQECSTTGVFEARLERRIKAAAEGRPFGAADAALDDTAAPTAALIASCARRDRAVAEGADKVVTLNDPEGGVCVPFRCRLRGGKDQDEERAIEKCKAEPSLWERIP